MARSALFLSASTMGDSLGGIGRAHRPTFEEAGLEFIEINFDEPDTPRRLDRAVAGGNVAFAFTYAGMGAGIACENPEGKEVNFWAALGIPFISLKGDSPAYYFDRHMLPAGPFACFYFFPEHLRLRKRLPHAEGLMGVVPPIPFELTPESKVDFRAKESGKLLFLKNGNDPEKLLRSWQGAFSATTFIMLSDLAGELSGRLDAGDEVDIDSLVCRYFADRRFDVEAVARLRILFVAQLDDYLRRLKSTLIAEVLRDFPVQIQGYNWEHVDFSRGRAKFVAGGDYTRSRADILGALGTVDMSPNTSEAPHERPLRAFGLRTLCITNDQRYFRENCAQWESFTYRFSRESLQARIAEVIAHPKRHVELGREVAAQFCRDHPPHQFPQFLIEASDLLRTTYSARGPGLQDYFAWPPRSF